jgi:hypothetical protein
MKENVVNRRFNKLDGERGKDHRKRPFGPKVHYSDLSPIEQFVSLFPEAQDADQIFHLLD